MPEKREAKSSKVVEELLRKLFPQQTKIFDSSKVLIQLKSSTQSQIQEEILLDK